MSWIPAGRSAPLIYPPPASMRARRRPSSELFPIGSVLCRGLRNREDQTILNIIASNIMQDRTTAVVSNNVSAVEKRCGQVGPERFGFRLRAGEGETKGGSSEPTDLSDSLEAWDMASEDRERLLAEVSELVGGLGRPFKDRERLAEIDASIDAYEREYGYFKAYAESLGTGTNRAA